MLNGDRETLQAFLMRQRGYRCEFCGVDYPVAKNHRRRPAMFVIGIDQSPSDPSELHLACRPCFKAIRALMG